MLLSARPGWAQAEALHWGLQDSAGRGWGLVLFSPADAADPSAWRLRLTLRTPGLALSHHSPLLLDDGAGHHWQLANCSDELVAASGALLPVQSAQFDLGGLLPRPSGALPLHLQVPLDEGVAELMVGAEPVAALSGLPQAGSVQQLPNRRASASRNRR